MTGIQYLGVTADAAVRRAGHGRSLALIAAGLLACTAMTSPAWSQSAGASAAPSDAPADAQEIVVTGSLGALPLKDVGSVFGFNKTLVETPRSASTVSSEQLERFGITQIYDLVTQVPGTFSSSYFGTGGALEIRGTPGEVYFRGMLRLENGGNYPTPIGAADRIDIVRGPASPIYGPSKTGGYMNFVPKTARAANGTYASKATGDVEADFDSFGRKVLKGAITGPGKIGGHDFGYSLYGEVEDSDSYYRNVTTRNTLFSAAFDTDITSNLRTEFGGMYQNFKGQQNSGWNRITQDLIDNGTYITGNAANNLDTNHDGKLSRPEVYAANGGQGLTIFGSYGCGVFNNSATGYTPACLKANYPDLALQNPGTTHLSRKDTLTGENDKLNNIQKTGYFDLIWKGAGELEIKNQVFYDGTKNLNENAYGFSQAINAYVVEDKIVVSDTFYAAPAKIALQVSPSLRYTHFKFGDDYGAEFWNRPDISTGFVPASTRLLSTQCGCDYSDYINGHYLDAGIAGLVNVTFDFGLDLLGGIRYDHIHAVSNADKAKYDPVSYSNNEAVSGDPTTFINHASNSDGGVSWNASISYKTPIGLIPYFTASRQTTIVAGEGAELEPSAVLTSSFLAQSKLLEAGIKGEFLDKRLYAAVAVYKQQRTDAAAESSLTNQVVKTKGIEAEIRWSVDRHLLVSANYTYIQVVDQSALAGNFFNYYGIGDLVNVPQSQAYLYLGGSQIGLISPATKKLAERPGIPHHVASATGTYAFDNGIALNGDVSHVSSTYSGYTQHVKLPAYWLLNLGASYKTGPFLFRAVVKNVNNARYFRAGGQDLFGADIVLPQTPRSIQGSIEFKF
ncbi:TonB-dependent siderophore receptor [Sphingomonas sp. MMS24-J13]|uniref:TonB-dependent siderophore receptor n=1 Tax=Sphingomonas sp. MMS24-J13 TaxID=3238686 RepID=UPI00384A4ECA